MRQLLRLTTDEDTRDVYQERWTYREVKISGKYARIEYQIVIDREDGQVAGPGIQVGSEALGVYIVDLHNAELERLLEKQRRVEGQKPHEFVRSILDEVGGEK